MWVDGLHHSYHLSGPEHFIWGTKSEVAHKCVDWPKTLAVWVVPDASQWGTESEVARKWADWLHKPCRMGVPNA